MSLPKESIDTILDYLDPYLGTLQTGFPTSSRPNEPSLTTEQKRTKIARTLAEHPGVFLTTWGSVILYPRPTASYTKPDRDPILEGAQSTAAAEKETGVGNNVSSLASEPTTRSEAIDDSVHLRRAREILVLFTPLSADYEIKYNLMKLGQHLQRLEEHGNFERSKQQTSLLSSPLETLDNTDKPTDHVPLNNDNSSDGNPKTLNTAENANETKSAVSGSSELFMQSTVSQSTRRNRRLNYLLRYLAPEDPSDSYAAPQVNPHHVPRPSRASRAAGNGNPGSYNANGNTFSSSSNPGSSQGRRTSQSNPQHSHISVASVLSLSGSLSGLSFSESTYFSDAEMQARAPELYHQYIGRFMDSDLIEEDEDEDDDALPPRVRERPSTATNNRKDDENGSKQDQQLPSSHPLREMGLVDRVLWNIDNPAAPRVPPSSLNPNQTSASREGREAGQADNGDQSEEFEEEFDTDSEDEDAPKDPKSLPQSNGQASIGSGSQPRRGPFAAVDNDDEMVARMSITPPVPPTPEPGLVSSTMASAALTLEQPLDRSRFASVENGNDMDEEEEDDDTAQRKEYQEGLRQDYVLLMKQRFLDGLDTDFDYSTVDFDDELDDLEQENHDQEDRWFDEDDPMGDMSTTGENGGSTEQFANRGSSSSRQGQTTGTLISSKMNLDERIRAWEESAQNGSGDYDY
ncbi:hypothetical protein BGW38_006604 [Lunasporangiospora selenospora]|uniref:CCD97-like C-terminal domain-containing protein n=1 Tax=Lunasporangiospora selenospora TaxID=979761 RepID=A0A9P6KAN8_9FUNG|nr:hypothetical protein BGW38_006604 [Lunasporangiospora selenospora]